MSAFHVDIECRRGGFLLDAEFRGDAGLHAIIGPNGAGKSTLLRALVGAQPSPSGIIRVGDRELLNSKKGVWVPPELRHLAFLPQGPSLYSHLSTTQNMVLGIPPAQRKQQATHLSQARELLTSWGYGRLADRPVSSLSGGEQQVIALARAWMMSPSMYLLDEPFSALDVEVRARMREILRQHLAMAPVPTLLVTHDVQDVIACADKVILLVDGRVVESDTLGPVRKNRSHAFLQHFFYGIA